MKKFLLATLLLVSSACATAGQTDTPAAHRFKVGSCLVYSDTFLKQLDANQRQAAEQIKQVVDGTTAKYYVIEFYYKGKQVSTVVAPFALVDDNAEATDCDAPQKQTTSDFSQK
jgi:hypothetical protein